MTDSSIETIYNNESVVISELIKREFNNPIGHGIIERFSSLFNQNLKLKILDIGCGRGKFSCHLAKNFGHEVLGVDLSEDMLKKAQNEARHLGVDHLVCFEKNEFISLNTENKFDLALGLDVFSYFNDQRALFSKLGKVLKDSSYLIFTDYFCSDPKNEKVINLTCRIPDTWTGLVPHNGTT